MVSRAPKELLGVLNIFAVLPVETDVKSFRICKSKNIVGVVLRRSLDKRNCPAKKGEEIKLVSPPSRYPCLEMSEY